jgi:hypothetical protein
MSQFDKTLSNILSKFQIFHFKKSVLFLLKNLTIFVHFDNDKDHLHSFFLVVFFFKHIYWFKVYGIYRMVHQSHIEHCPRNKSNSVQHDTHEEHKTCLKTILVRAIKHISKNGIAKNKNVKRTHTLSMNHSPCKEM